MKRNKLYKLLFIACIAGYAWLFLNSNQFKIKSFDVCFIKHTTNIPCPSCGSTRSVMLLSHGEFKEALLINPLGYVLAFILIAFPLWIIIDILNRKKTLFDCYKFFESKLKMPQYAIPLAMLLCFNWIWNIIKGV